MIPYFSGAEEKARILFSPVVVTWDEKHEVRIEDHLTRNRCQFVSSRDAFAHGRRKHLASLENQRCRLSVRKVTRSCVPNADFTLSSTTHSEPLGPGEGRVRRQKWRPAHLVHARLSSSVRSHVSKLCACEELWKGRYVLVLNWKDGDSKVAAGRSFFLGVRSLDFDESAESLAVT